MNTTGITDLLTEARNYLAVPGQWSQRETGWERAESIVDKRSMFGAVLSARLPGEVDDEQVAFDRFVLAVEFLKHTVELEGFTSLKEFNDHPENNLDDILMMFDITIARLNGTLR